MANSKQVKYRSKIKMTGDLDSSRRRQRQMLSNSDQHSYVCQSWVYQEPPPYPVRTASGWNRRVQSSTSRSAFSSAPCSQCCQCCRRPLYLPSHDQSKERGIRETKAAVCKRSNKNGGTPHNRSAGTVFTDNQTTTDYQTAKQSDKQHQRSRGQAYIRRGQQYNGSAETVFIDNQTATDHQTAKQSNKQNQRSRGQAYIRRGQLRAEEYRRELEALQSSIGYSEQDTPPMKETRDSTANCGPTAKQGNKQKPRNRGPAHNRRSQLRAEEHRKKLEALQCSVANYGQDTSPIKETRDSYSQTISSTLATYKVSTGVEEQTETMVAYEGINDHDRLIPLGETKLLMATMSQILRHLSRREDIRWPRPDSVTKSILPFSNLSAPYFMSPEAVVEKVFEACNELKLDLHSEEDAFANWRADCRQFMKHSEETFSFALHDIYIILILIIIAASYLDSFVM